MDEDDGATKPEDVTKPEEASEQAVTRTTRSSLAPKLPATPQDLVAQRIVHIGMTLNDYVDQIHVQLWLKPEYKQYFIAVWDEDAIEGWTIADDIFAAQMIKQYAFQHDVFVVSGKRIAAIVKSLRVVCRRYNIGRYQRRNMIDGEVVAGGNNEHN